MEEDGDSKEKKLEIISPVFRDGGQIPIQYTCKGQNVNPPINILFTPRGTKSLALVMHDPDAVSGDFLHWLLYDIPPKTDTISVNSVPIGAMQGANGKEEARYMGPCPPAGTGSLRYIFDFYALDTMLGLPTKSTMDEVIKAMKGQVLDHQALTGTFQAEN